jgi:hypothetical protein
MPVHFASEAKTGRDLSLCPAKYALAEAPAINLATRFCRREFEKNIPQRRQRVADGLQPSVSQAGAG